MRVAKPSTPSGAALAAALVSLVATNGARAEETLPPGTLSPKVVCRHDPTKSYALYLPSAYVPEKRWPILYLYEARARGAPYTERFRPAAEALGWIVATSNEVQSDGPLDPALKAAVAVLADTDARLSIDPKRRYAGGFSGGARLATILGAIVKGGLAGVVLSGAGFAEEYPPTKETPFAVAGLVGDFDYNFVEMRSLRRKLGKLGVANHLSIFSGRHEWAPADHATAALEFLELAAVRKSLAPRREELLDRLFAARLADAKKLDAAGDDLVSFRAHDALARDFDGLRDVAAIRARADSLAATKAVKRGLKEEESVDEKEGRLLAKLEAELRDAFARDPLPPAASIVRALGVPALGAQASSSDFASRATARRVLTALQGKTGFYLPTEFRERNDAAREKLSFAVAEEIAKVRERLD